jgi:small subunit ribosomal protein S2
MLTNFQTVHKRLQKLKELEEIDFDDVAKSGMTKKELLVLRRERDKLLKTLGGIRDMSKVPSAVWIVDTNKEHIAVAEARKLNIPVVAILDSNCDPDIVDFPIPGNDDAIRAVALLTRVIADAVADGLMARAGRGSAAAADEGVVAADEPLAAWEAELLAGSDSPVEVPTSAAEEVATEVAAEEPAAGSAEADAEDAAAAAIAETPDEAAAEVAAEAVADAVAETTEAPADQA